MWVYASCLSWIHLVFEEFYVLLKLKTAIIEPLQLEKGPYDICDQSMYICTDPSESMLGPVVQSVVNLTSSLSVILLTVLADSIHNMLKFFAEKMWVAFALQKLLTFFQQKISAYLRITQCKF